MALTQSRLKEMLLYDPITGLFYWRFARRGIRAGQKAGCDNSHGYAVISVDNTLHGAHRLAWLYMTGAMPKEHIDHINGDRGDNRWKNLREATLKENNRSRNSNSNNKSGYRGVCFDKVRNKWKAQITVDRKTKLIGRFDTPEQASEAYKNAAKHHFGEFYMKKETA